MNRLLVLWSLFLVPGLIYARTPLELAVRAKNVKRVEKLLAEGADPNGIDENSVWGMTPLSAAGRYGAVKAAAVLLDHGADPNLRDDSGSTALLWAIKQGHEDMVPLLLKHGAKTEMATDDGSNRTPLFWAVLEKQEKTVAALLAAGADPKAIYNNIYENKQKPILQIAKERSTPRIVAMLEEHLE